MVRRQHEQRSVFEMILPDGDQLWDDTLRRIDEILEDEELVERVEEALARRRPKSRTRGRRGTPAAVVLRLLVLKHLYDWSFEDCEREVRRSLVYRAFCQIDCERVPDAKTMIRLAQAVGPEVCQQIQERLVALARQRKVAGGRRLRVDTTVVETNIHHPTDSALLGDGVRVITRTVKKLEGVVGKVKARFRDRTRSIRRRIFEIVLHSRKRGDPAQEKMKGAYRKLMGTTRAVLREAQRAVEGAKRKARQLSSDIQQQVKELRQDVAHMSELTRQVVAQTKARVLEGDTHYPHKIFSVFETHTEAVRKGKAAKPTEFGKVVKIQEAENQFISDYAVCSEGVPDPALWGPSLERHRALFGRPPELATADGGFASAANERQAQEMGVKHVVLLRRRRSKGGSARAAPRSRWWERARRWRTGCEGRISILKRRHGMRRCRYRGLRGMQRWVGLAVISNNLLVLGRAAPPKEKRRATGKG
jgi:transposase, IS5 family